MIAVGRGFEKLDSGLVVPVAKNEEPDRTLRSYYANHFHRYSDMLRFLNHLSEMRADLVSVSRHGVGGVCENAGYVVNYLHHEALEIEVKT